MQFYPDGTTKRQQYLLRAATLKSERSSWIPRYQTITNYLLPYAGRYFSQDRNRGSRSFNNILDESGTYAHGVLAAGLMAGMSSPARPWFRLATPDLDLMEYEPVKQWLFKTSELMRAIFAKSNTYLSLHSLYEELGAFATGVTIIEENFEKVIHHTVLTAGEYCLAANDLGEIDTLAREYEMTVGQLVTKFVYNSDPYATPDWSKVSVTVKDLWDRRSYDALVTVNHIVQPRLSRDVTRLDASNMRFASCYFESGRDDADDKLLRDSGYKRFPALAPRWNVRGGDVYGHGPSFTVLGSLMQLQQQQLRKGQGIDFMVKPPLQVPVEMRNNLNTQMPGGVSYFSASSQARKIESAWDVKLDLSHLLLDVQDVRQRIERGFYSDLFLMISRDQRQQRATATEIVEKHEEKLLMLGPTLERLHNELLAPKIDVTFDRCVEAGLLPPIPEELADQDLKVDFISPLAQAQKMVGLGSLDRLLGTVGQIAAGKQDPSVWDKVDHDQAIDRYAEMLGTDPSVVRSDEKVEIIRTARADAQAQAANAQLQESQAKTAKDLAAANTEGPNALTDIIRQVQGYNATV